MLLNINGVEFEADNTKCYQITTDEQNVYVYEFNTPSEMRDNDSEPNIAYSFKRK